MAGDLARQSPNVSVLPVFAELIMARVTLCDKLPHRLADQ